MVSKSFLNLSKKGFYMPAKKLYILTSVPVSSDKKDTDGRKLLNGVSYSDKPLTKVFSTQEALNHYDLVEEWCKRHDEIPLEIVVDCTQTLSSIIEFNSDNSWSPGRFAYLTKEPLDLLENLCLLARDNKIKTELRIRYNGFN